MRALWTMVRDLLAVLPRGSSRFVVVFAACSGALAILDVAALGLLALTLSPLLSGSSLNLPVLGEIPADQVPYLLAAVGGLIITKSILAIVLQWLATRRFAIFEQELGVQLLNAF